jgi:hypothetical protein
MHGGRLYIVVFIDVVQIYHPLSAAFKHGSICDGWPNNETNRSVLDQKHPCLNHNYDVSCLNEKLHPGIVIKSMLHK